MKNGDNTTKSEMHVPSGSLENDHIKSDVCIQEDNLGFLFTGARCIKCVV